MMLGAHVSAAGGLHNSISNGEKLECEAIQIFLKNPNRWVGKEPAESDIEQFREAWSASDIVREGLSTTSTSPTSPLPSRMFLRILVNSFFLKWSSRMPVGFGIL